MIDASFPEPNTTSGTKEVGRLESSKVEMLKRQEQEERG